MECLNCKSNVNVVEIEKYMTLVCEDCNCIMKCLDVKENVSNWRVMNPFDIEDRRNNKI